MWSSQLAGAAASRLINLLETPILDDGAARAVPHGHDVVFENEDVGDVVLSTAQREVVMVLRGERKDRVA